MAKQAIISTRFSPRPNAEECRSCEKQEERCRDYCRRQGYAVVGVYHDRDVSGGVLSRPGLSAALDAMRPGMVLVVDAGDRLARDMLVALTIRFEIQKAGGTIEYADGSPVSNTPEGELFANILAAFAAYERARIRRGTSRGMKRRQAGGDWFGRPPVGWKLDPNNTKRLVHCLSEQAAMEWAVALKKRGYSSEDIAEILTANAGLFRGRPWSGRTVRKLVAQYH